MSFNFTAAASAATFPIVNANKVQKSHQYKHAFIFSNTKSNNLEHLKMNGKKSLNNNKKYDLEAQFKAACDVIQNLPKNGPFQPSNELLLKFYGYYKQASFLLFDYLLVVLDVKFLLTFIGDMWVLQ